MVEAGHFKEAKSSSAEHRKRLYDLYQELGEQWDGEESIPPMQDAYYQTQIMLMLMEVAFDQDIMDAFFVVRLTDGGLVIEFFDPTDKRNDQGILDNPKGSASFDTTIGPDGSVNFWRCQGLYFDGRKLQHDYEFDTEFDAKDVSGADMITLWLDHAHEFNAHMREKIDKA